MNMDAHQFLAVAGDLVESVRSDPAQPNAGAMCRTAVGRAYYALFLLAREFVSDLDIETRSVPSIHALLEQALRNSGVLSLARIGNALGELRDQRTDADYEMRDTTVETVENAGDVLDDAKAAILQLDLIRAGRLSPPLDRTTVVEAILKWASDNSKPLWRKG